MLVLADLARKLGSFAAAVMLVAIVSVLGGPESPNAVAGWCLSAAASLGAPFAGLLDLSSAKADVAADWAVSGLGYVVAGRLAGRLFEAAARGELLGGRLGAI